MASTSASKCPVCGWDVTANGRDVKVGGRSVRVCSDECAKEVITHPDKYARS